MYVMRGRRTRCEAAGSRWARGSGLVLAAEDVKAERVDWVYIDENWGENVDGRRRERRRRMIRWERGVRELARKQTHVRCGPFPKSSLLIAVYSEGKSSQRGHFPPARTANPCMENPARRHQRC
jgi:hypothetical protein